MAVLQLQMVVRYLLSLSAARYVHYPKHGRQVHYCRCIPTRQLAQATSSALLVRGLLLHGEETLRNLLRCPSITHALPYRVSLRQLS